ncbi:MAG: hypothetical protein ACEPOV_00230 [Hyphomicrobiales bacterium]
MSKAEISSWLRSYRFVYNHALDTTSSMFVEKLEYKAKWTYEGR